MAVTEFNSGVISLSSSGSWLQNIISRQGLTASQVFASPSSVARTWAIPVGSNDVIVDALLNV